jgi:hypothetical protein
MMEIQVGDVFKCYNTFPKLFKIVRIDNDLIQCNVYYNNIFVGITSDNKNTLLKMQKLSSLERELM